MGTRPRSSHVASSPRKSNPEPTFRRPFRCQTFESAAEGRFPASEVYARLSDQGVVYGPRFQVIESIASTAHEVLAVLHLDPILVAELPGMPWHPALLDGALQSVMGLLLAADRPQSLAPYSVETISCTGHLETASLSHMFVFGTAPSRARPPSTCIYWMTPADRCSR